MCVCLYDSNTHDSTEVQMECIPKCPLSLPETMATFTQQQSQSTALVGVRVEPLEELVLKTPASGTQASSLPSMTEFSQKMVENLFNYASSFAVDPRQSPLAPGETYIPSSTLRDWYNTFQRRLAANPNFWKSL